MREDFSVKIVECSTPVEELSAKDRIKLKDTSSAVALDGAVSDDASITITPIGYAVLEVHNDKAKGDKDYQQTLIMADDGERYITGSQSFYNSFRDIWDELDFPATGEKFEIKIYRKPSKNYAGKSFITCALV